MRPTCTIEGCEKPHQARGLCGKHYKNWRDGVLAAQVREARARQPRACKHCGGPIPPERTQGAFFCGPQCKRKAQWAREKASPVVKQNAPCTVDGCQSSIFATQLCQKHYARLRAKGTLDDTRKNARGKCSIEGCGRAHVADGLCDPHYRRERSAEKRMARAAILDQRTCMQCGGPLVGRPSDAMFCSRTCKTAERVSSGAAAEASRRHHFRAKYGLTPERVEEMAAKGCAICGTTDWPGRHGRPHVDHCHKTGVVRDILCSDCNTGLGRFKDQPDLLIRAAEYLRAHADRIGEAEAA